MPNNDWSFNKEPEKLMLQDEALVEKQALKIKHQSRSKIQITLNESG